MKERSVIEVVILSIVTLGIYQLYWSYVVNNELREQKQDVAPVKWFVIPLLIVLGGFIASLILGGIGVALGEESGIGSVFAGFALALGVVAYVLFFPLFFGTYGYWIYWLYKFCMALEKESHKKIEFILTFLVGLLVGGVIWVGITQHLINERIVSKVKA